jgi:hypothetical protein
MTPLQEAIKQFRKKTAFGKPQSNLHQGAAKPKPGAHGPTTTKPAPATHQPTFGAKPKAVSHQATFTPKKR